MELLTDANIHAVHFIQQERVFQAVNSGFIRAVSLITAAWWKQNWWDGSDWTTTDQLWTGNTKVSAVWSLSVAHIFHSITAASNQIQLLFSIFLSTCSERGVWHEHLRKAIVQPNMKIHSTSTHPRADVRMGEDLQFTKHTWSLSWKQRCSLYNI